jgi:hypothetical protein
MRESSHGRDEANAKNNHGTYYDLQIASFALFVDRAAIGRQVLEDARTKRLDAQIEADGRQPLELARTRSFSYSVMNIDGLTQLATLGERVGVDLWNYSARPGTTPALRAALLYLAPYALGEKKWPYPQIGTWTPSALFPVLRRAAAHYRDEEFSTIVRKLPPRAPTDRAILLMK